jgi:cyclase
VETVVPGHGAVTDKRGVREMRDYLSILRDEARARFDTGLSWVDAAEEIIADHFTHWIDRERIFVNVNSLYREFDEQADVPSVMQVYEVMAGWCWDHGHTHPAN